MIDRMTPEKMWGVRLLSLLVGVVPIFAAAALVKEATPTDRENSSPWLW
jgi:hypothetical protein